ncbi:MAG: hypothetical protein HZA94_02500 [Candidatus Vogelbacteria bacterium]|nr:hypothetical protein [Candidatus Vogelbacteria bacterium]
MEDEAIIRWTSMEHDLEPKSSDWYISLIVIGASIAIASVLADNILLAIFAILATIAVIIHASQKPETLYFEITQHGILANQEFVPYPRIHSFCVREIGGKNELIIRTDKFVLPYIIIHLDNVPPGLVRNTLLRNLDEIYRIESLPEKALRYLGF